MRRGQGSVAIVAILVVFVLVLSGVVFYFRNDLFGPTIVNAKETIREKTVIRENSTTIIDDDPDTIVVNNPTPVVENNVFVNNSVYP